MLRRIEITTDYPVLGDSDHSVTTGWAWAWDRDKYVQISIDDQLYWVKRGYIRRKSDGKPLGDYQLAYLPEKAWSNSGKPHTPGALPTRRDAAREVMADRRLRSSSFEIYKMDCSQDVVSKHGSVHEAVSALLAAGPGHALYVTRRWKNTSSGGTAASIRPRGEVVAYVSGRRGRADISAKQIRRLLRGAP
jgi:hypothetical protein